jgi:hypothetical protein
MRTTYGERACATRFPNFHNVRKLEISWEKLAAVICRRRSSRWPTTLLVFVSVRECLNLALSCSETFAA